MDGAHPPGDVDLPGHVDRQRAAVRGGDHGQPRSKVLSVLLQLVGSQLGYR